MAKKTPVVRSNSFLTVVGSNEAPLSYVSAYRTYDDNYELSVRVQSGRRTDVFELILSPSAANDLLTSLASKLGKEVITPQEEGSEA